MSEVHADQTIDTTVERREEYQNIWVEELPLQAREFLKEERYKFPKPGLGRSTSWKEAAPGFVVSCRRTFKPNLEAEALKAGKLPDFLAFALTYVGFIFWFPEAIYECLRGSFCCKKCGSSERVVDWGWSDLVRRIRTRGQVMYYVSRSYVCKRCPQATGKGERQMLPYPGLWYKLLDNLESRPSDTIHVEAQIPTSTPWTPKWSTSYQLGRGKSLTFTSLTKEALMGEHLPQE